MTTRARSGRIMVKFYLIGIGPGDPKYLTIEAVEAIKNTQVFFLPKKGGEKEELLKIRKEVLERFARPSHRVRELTFPARERASLKSDAYFEKVERWRRGKAQVLARAISEELGDGETGALLLWGDPAFYDGHIEILKEVERMLPHAFAWEVIPGISALQVLSARHKLSLTEIGGSLQITTGRGLRQMPPEEVRNVIVFLDNYLSFWPLRDQDLEIYWGAYLGMPGEVVISGRLCEVAERVSEVRRKLRGERGWIMETYLLRRRRP